MAKKITVESIKVLLDAKADYRGYLKLKLNYGFTQLKGGKTEYLPIVVSTGIAIEKGNWQDGWFRSLWMSKNKKKYAEINAEIEAQKEKLFEAFRDLQNESGGMIPPPANVIARFKGGESKTKKQTSAKLLVDYIDEYIAKHVTDERSQKKFYSVRWFVAALDAVRAAGALKPWQKGGNGPLFLHTMNLDDWSDIRSMFDHVCTEIPRIFRNQGVEGLVFKEKGTKYKEVTVSKYQSDLASVLRQAAVDGYRVELNVETLERASRIGPVKEWIRHDELDLLIRGRMPDHMPGTEQARKLMVLGIMSGSRYEDYHTILSKKIHRVKGEDLEFDAIAYVSSKTKTPCLIPLFEPLRQIIEEHKTNPIKVPSNTQLNIHFKTVARHLGLDRAQHVVRTFASGEVEDDMVPLHEVVSSHTGRRSCVTGMAKLMAPKETIAAITGHALSRKDSIELYYSMSMQERVATLIRAIYIGGRAANLPFKWFSDDMLEQLEPKPLRKVG